MLTHWTLENFKPIRERLDVPVAPLTVLAGLNSSGKSSFLQSILLVSQTMANQKLDEPLVLNGPLVRLGTFQDVCNERAPKTQLRIGFRLDVSSRADAPGAPAGSLPIPLGTARRLSARADILFESVPPREEEGAGLHATRAALARVDLTVDLAGGTALPSPEGPRSVVIERATSAEEAEILAGVAQSTLSVLPYPIGHNYIARFRAPSSVRSPPQLVQFAHMIPHLYVYRREATGLENLLDRLANAPPDEQGSPDQHPALFTRWLRHELTNLGQMKDHQLIHADVLRRINDIAAEHSIEPLPSTQVSSLSQWLRDLPTQLRADEHVRRRILAAMLSRDSMDEVYDLVRSSASASPIANLLDQAARSLIGTFSSAIRYLGPLRADPYAIQSYSPSGQPDDVGPKGEYAAAVFSASRKQPVRWWNPISQAVETAALEEAMDAWLRHLGVADHVATRETGAPGVSWMVRSTARTRERPLQAVGVGVSQVLPILVAGLLAPEGTILVMEQPELHLHERPQARLGDFFYGLTRLGKQVFVETHSAVLISQLRYIMVKRGQEARDAMAIYFVGQDEEGDARFEPIHISTGGDVENWPDGFFDEGFRQEDRITQEGIRARGKRGHA